MARLRLYLLIAVLLILTVPWWFTVPADRQILGMPAWAAYSLGMSVLFAVVMAALLKRFWELSAGKDDDG
ncbi:MAG: hypothetical protein ACE5F3_03995 [Mariprofundaceae bacterium]